MAELERTYTVPLSRAWIAPRYRRTKRAVNILREFAEKHMKSREIRIETELNEELWKKGITRPPRRITVEMSKDEDGVVTISLPKAPEPLVPEEAPDVETIQEEEPQGAAAPAPPAPEPQKEPEKAEVPEKRKPKKSAAKKKKTTKATTTAKKKSPQKKKSKSES